MTEAQLSALLVELLALPNETEWVEFKENVTDPDMIGKRAAALANAVALIGRPAGYLVWGVEDGTHRVTGTTFKPAKLKKGGEALVNWLIRLLTPQVDFHFHEWAHGGKSVVLLEIPAATHQPISFSGQEYIRIDSHTKLLKEHPERERALWAMFSTRPSESGSQSSRRTPRRRLDSSVRPCKRRKLSSTIQTCGIATGVTSLSGHKSS